MNSNISYLDKRINSHNSQVRLTLGVVHQVQVDKLLQFQIIRLHAVDHIREQRAEQ